MHKTELANRILEDLAHLGSKYSLVPDVMLVTGDIAESARPSEYEAAAAFIQEVAVSLSIPPSNLLLIPGNHDISWAHCDAYFSSCLAEETDPTPPYLPKWASYNRFAERVLGSVSPDRLTGDRLHKVHDFPDYGVAIALLDSTIAESHLKDDHYGFLGEQQLRAVAGELRPLTESRFCIAALHHNPLPVGDEREFLRDADDLNHWLTPYIDVVLHGHTHNGGEYRLAGGSLALPTGSAAVKPDARPSEVPNQYQVLRIDNTGLHRYGRRYEPDLKRWIGDGRVNPPEDTWIKHYPHGRSPARLRKREGRRAPLVDAVPQLKLGGEHAGDDFATRVLEVARLRYPGASISLFSVGRPPCDYLRVTRQEGVYIRQHPIGIDDTGDPPVTLDRFLTTVQARYRSVDPLAPSLFVTSEPPDESLRERALKAGVVIQTFREFQGLLDLSSYTRRLSSVLSADDTYSPELYLPQKYTDVLDDGASRRGPSALGYLCDRLQEPAGFVGLVLGDFGVGKTFLTRQIARRLLAAKQPCPVLIELRTVEKARSVDALLAQHFAQAGETNIDLQALHYMISEGMIVLLFDGFDELAARVTYDRAAEHLGVILDIAVHRAKVVLTSRSQFFVSNDQVVTEQGRRFAYRSELLELHGFEPEDVKRFIRRRFSNDEALAEEYVALLARGSDIAELSQNPRMLAFICELPIDDLRSAIGGGMGMSAGLLYQTLIARWLGYEFARVAHPGVGGVLTASQRLSAASYIAYRMWVNGTSEIALDELGADVEDALFELSEAEIPTPYATHQVGSGSLLVRDGEASFRFVHRSIAEWLVAYRAAEMMTASRLGGVWQVDSLMAAGRLSPLMCRFLRDLVAPDALRQWVSAVLADASREASQVKENALLLVENGVTLGSVQAQLKHADLRGRALKGVPLREADLSYTRAVGTDLRGAELGKADLRGADLRRADLRDAKASGANLRQAILQGADCRGTDFTGAATDGTDFRRADLRGTVGLELSTSQLVGAALGERTDRQVGPPLEAISSLALTPLDGVILVGTVGGHVGVIDVFARQAIRSVEVSAAVVELRSTDDIVCSVDGTGRVTTFLLHNLLLRDSVDLRSGPIGLASLSSDLAFAAVAVADTGFLTVCRTSDGDVAYEHEFPDRIGALAWNRRGSSLAIVLRDGSVSVLGTRVFTSLLGANISAAPFPGAVATSSDGQLLAVGGLDGTVTIWRVADGVVIGRDASELAGIASVGFSEDDSTVYAVAHDGAALAIELHAGGGRIQRRPRRQSAGALSCCERGGSRYIDASLTGEVVRLGQFGVELVHTAEIRRPRSRIHLVEKGSHENEHYLEVPGPGLLGGPSIKWRLGTDVAEPPVVMETVLKPLRGEPLGLSAMRLSEELAEEENVPRLALDFARTTSGRYLAAVVGPSLQLFEVDNGVSKVIFEHVLDPTDRRRREAKGFFAELKEDGGMYRVSEDAVQKREELIAREFPHLVRRLGPLEVLGRVGTVEEFQSMKAVETAITGRGAAWSVRAVADLDRFVVVSNECLIVTHTGAGWTADSSPMGCLRGQLLTASGGSVLAVSGRELALYDSRSGECRNGVLSAVHDWADVLMDPDGFVFVLRSKDERIVAFGLTRNIDRAYFRTVEDAAKLGLARRDDGSWVLVVGHPSGVLELWDIDGHVERIQTPMGVVALDVADRSVLIEYTDGTLGQFQHDLGGLREMRVLVGWDTQIMGISDDSDAGGRDPGVAWLAEGLRRIV